MGARSIGGSGFVRAMCRVVAVAALLIGPALPAYTEGGPPVAGGEVRENPHVGIECSKCHVKVPEKGKTPWADVLTGLTKDPVEICRECHSVAEVNHHPVQRKTGRALPEGLPVSAAGEVVCSTCHDVHLKASRASLLRGFDTGRYSVRMDMCLDCHGETFAALNPHRSEEGSEKCSTCHAGRPKAADNAATVALQEKITQICNFCHNVKAKAHPQNVSPGKILPVALPRSMKGDIHCGTCHDPHATGDTLHFLRAQYVAFLEGGRDTNPHSGKDYASCRGCHAGISTKKEEMRKNRLYGGDDMLICLSCHGSMDACHPILIKPLLSTAKDLKLPLTSDGKITCLTCHNPMPVSGTGVGMRDRKAGDASNIICFRCHDKADLGEKNPHSTMTDRDSCKFCHDTMTDPTNEESSRVSFISNTRLICLRCHAQDFHPMGVNHMVAPKMAIPDPFRLDGKGKVTCTTCHNPHIEARAIDGGGRKRRFVADIPQEGICSRCHRR